MQQQRKAEAEQHKKLMEKLLKKISQLEKMKVTENYQYERVKRWGLLKIIWY